MKGIAKMVEDLEVNWNLEIIAFDRGKKRMLYQHTHNIIVSGGRQFICENLAAATFPTSSTFTRQQNTVVRYIGFGIGGSRQTATEASSSPLSTDYAGTNTQTDSNVAVARLERPVQVSSGIWMNEVAAPATYGSASEVTWTATFGAAAINYGSYTTVPLSEIALYKSSADPAQSNGGAGTYPGPTGHIVAYDTFAPVYKTGFVSLQVNWTWRM